MTLSKLENTTKVQDKLIQYWKDFEKEHGEPPSLSEAARDLDYASASSVQDTIKRLVSKGLMEPKPIKSDKGWRTGYVLKDDQEAGQGKNVECV